MSAAKYQKPILKLSFEDDENEEDITSELQAKKSKAIKKLKKKMRQAPDAIAAVETTVEHASFGGSYGADSLAELKQNQIFTVAPKSETDGLIGIELVGDDAEKLESINEGDINEESIKHMPIPAISISSKSSILDNITNNQQERLSTSFPVKKVPDYVPLDQDNAGDIDGYWENDILKRALSRPLPIQMNQKNSNEQMHLSSKLNVSNISHNINYNINESHRVSLQDIMASLQKNIHTLQDIYDSNERKLQTLKINFQESKKQESKLEEQVKEDANRVMSLQVMKHTYKN